MTIRHLHFDLLSGFAHPDCWPYIDIIINSEVKFSGFIENNLSIAFDFESCNENVISIFYKNKRFGPEVWDTIVDKDGTIIADQYIYIKNIRIDECNLNFLISSIQFETSIGEKINSNGYLGFNGYFTIKYKEPYYDWVHDTRLSLFKPSSKVTESSLPFITNYVYDYNDKIISDLLNQMQETVDAAKKFNYNNPISRTT